MAALISCGHSEAFTRHNFFTIKICTSCTLDHQSEDDAEWSWTLSLDVDQQQLRRNEERAGHRIHSFLEKLSGGTLHAYCRPSNKVRGPAGRL